MPVVGAAFLLAIARSRSNPCRPRRSSVDGGYVLYNPRYCQSANRCVGPPMAHLLKQFSHSIDD